MDFIQYLIDNFDNIDIHSLTSSQLNLYNSIDKYVNYTVPMKEGKIVYNKEHYCNYCKLFKKSLKDNIIDINMNINQIYNKLQYDQLDKWTKLNIIKKLKQIELVPVYKTPFVSKIDKQYVDEIINLSQNVINDISNLYPIINIMKKYKLKSDDIINIILKNIHETSSEELSE